MLYSLIVVTTVLFLFQMPKGGVFLGILNGITALTCTGLLASSEIAGHNDFSFENCGIIYTSWGRFAFRIYLALTLIGFSGLGEVIGVLVVAHTIAEAIITHFNPDLFPSKQHPNRAEVEANVS